MEPTAFRVLLYLLRNPGRLVTKDEIMGAVWGDTAVSDNSLTRSVATLRRLLGDDPREPRYVATVQTMGYRFLGEVRKTEDRSAEKKAEEANGPAEPIWPIAGSDASAKVEKEDVSLTTDRVALTPKLLIAGMILIAVLGGYMIHYFASRKTERATPPLVAASSKLRIVPLTNLPGMAGNPALSPDGQQVAFFWNGETPVKSDLYVQLVGGEKPLQLTHSRSGSFWSLCCADWSPDGREIVFARCDDSGGAILMIPALGGTERKLTEVVCSFSSFGFPRWTPDGKSLVLTDRCTPNGRPGIVLFSLSTGDKKCLHAPPTGYVGDFFPGISPDGTTIAFIEWPNANMSELCTIEASGENFRQLTADRAQVWQLLWSQDGKRIAFASSRSGFGRIWQIPAGGGPIEPESVYPGIDSMSRDGRRLAYDEGGGFTSGSTEVWRLQLASAGGQVISQTRVLASGGGNMGAQLSPDGQEIVFQSGRSGSDQIWKSDADGANPIQLTSFKVGGPGTPRWSPDGKSIIFDGQIGVHTQIYLIDSEGRHLHDVTSGNNENNVVPSFSRDGRAVYFASNRTESWQIWRLELSTGQQTQMTHDGGFAAFESVDGRTLYFSKFDGGGLWSVPVNGGAEQHITDAPHRGDWGHFARDRFGALIL